MNRFVELIVKHRRFERVWTDADTAGMNLVEYPASVGLKGHIGRILYGAWCKWDEIEDPRRVALRLLPHLRMLQDGVEPPPVVLR